MPRSKRADPPRHLAVEGLIVEMNQEQLGLFVDDAYTQPRQILEALFAATRQMRRGMPRKAKGLPDLSQLNLELPLLPHWGGAVASEDSKSADLFAEPHTDVEPCTPDIQTEFANPTIELCAHLSAGMLWRDLRVLMYDRGRSDEKESILQWLFATDYPCRPPHVPMYRMPFTAQFACWVEEIDYEQLIESLHWLIEINSSSMPKKQESTEITQKGVLNGTKNSSGTFQHPQR